MSPWHRRAKQSPLALLNESRPLLLSREDVVHTLPYYDVDALRAFSFPEKSGANKQFPPPLGKIKIISIRNTIGGSNNSRSYDCSKPFPGKIWMPAAGYVLVNRDEVGSWEVGFAASVSRALC